MATSDSEEATSENVMKKILLSLNNMEKRLNRLEGNSKNDKSKNRTDETASGSREPQTEMAADQNKVRKPGVVEHRDKVCDIEKDPGASSSRGGSLCTRGRDGSDIERDSAQYVPAQINVPAAGTSRESVTRRVVTVRASVGTENAEKTKTHEISDTDSDMECQEDSDGDDDVYTQMRKECVTNNKDAESINKDLAFVVENKFDFPQPSDVLQKTMENFAIPENCQSLKPPTLDKELID